MFDTTDMAYGTTSYRGNVKYKGDVDKMVVKMLKDVELI